jgi:hypothetical protein
MDWWAMFGPMIAQRCNVPQIPIRQDRPLRSAFDAGRDQFEQDRAQLLL